VGAPSIRMRRRRAARQVLAVAGQALVDQVVVGVGRVLEHDAGVAQATPPWRRCRRCQRDVLDALAVVEVQVLLDLALVVAAFLVDRDADLAAGAGHRLALQPVSLPSMSK
jgi:hypothetical protein